MNRLFIVTILCLCTTVLSAQNILRGKIIDKETGLPISGAYISIKNRKQFLTKQAIIKLTFSQMEHVSLRFHLLDINE